MTESVNLTEGAEGQAVDYLFHASAEDFKKIPGSPIAYWADGNVLNCFDNFLKVSSYAESRKGMATGLNEKFVRAWGEVDFYKIGLSHSRDSAKDSSQKWFPYANGGEFRKWYGNYNELVNWAEDGSLLQTEKHDTGRIRAVNLNLDFIFKEGCSWTSITSGNFSIRLLPEGFLFSSASNALFPRKYDVYFFIGLLNSSVHSYISKFLNPTLNANPGDIAKIPLVPYDERFKALSKKLIDLSAIDWNTYETSWDFSSNQLIQLRTENPSQTLAEIYQAWWNSNQATIAEMQRLEEENNRLFIDAYGLQGELTPDVPLEEITLTVNPKYRYGGNASDAELAARFQSDTVCELFSYAIGCMMGRYSLNRPGLVYAHAGNEGFADLMSKGAYQTFPADDDGIIPITDEEWFADDATNRFVEFVKTVWGEAQLSENLSFIDESLCLHALKPKASESALETIRRYLSNQFYKDHMRTYKKRPIYWLFSSGKQKAFECVVYLHRYNESTLARMRTEYVIPLMGKYQAHAEQLQNQIDQADTTAQANKAKKALTSLEKKQHELTQFDEKLKHFADMRIALDLDDGVKVNYGKFGDLLVDVKGITGKKA